LVNFARFQHESEYHTHQQQQQREGMGWLQRGVDVGMLVLTLVGQDVHAIVKRDAFGY
jgi:hypothetical protein